MILSIQSHRGDRREREADDAAAVLSAAGKRAGNLTAVSELWHREQKKNRSDTEKKGFASPGRLAKQLP
jgi:hypothetical protein